MKTKNTLPDDGFWKLVSEILTEQTKDLEALSRGLKEVKLTINGVSQILKNKADYEHKLRKMSEQE